VADACRKRTGTALFTRDIKPANIIINERGQAKVLDFGLATIRGKNIDAKTKVATARTVKAKSGAIMGTVPYMSPEQVRANRLDAPHGYLQFRRDALRNVLRKPTFARDTDAETISAILRDEPSWADIPAELQRSCKSV